MRKCTTCEKTYADYGAAQCRRCQRGKVPKARRVCTACGVASSSRGRPFRDCPAPGCGAVGTMVWLAVQAVRPDETPAAP